MFKKLAEFLACLQSKKSITNEMLSLMPVVWYFSVFATFYIKMNCRIKFLDPK